MKTSRNSHVWVLCGLALGFAALWTATAPIIASGSAISGGWYIASIGAACEGPYDCAHCSGVYTDYCSSYDGICFGGQIEVIEGALEGYTGRVGSGSNNCDGECLGVENGDCW